MYKKATGDPHWVALSAKRALTHHASHFDVHVETCGVVQYASRFTHHASRITRMWSRRVILSRVA